MRLFKSALDAGPRIRTTRSTNSGILTTSCWLMHATVMKKSFESLTLRSRRFSTWMKRSSRIASMNSSMVRKPSPLVSIADSRHESSAAS
eukprot:CAMPEP_0176197266 /NCGR_PEP_ID=MMETSP0121_2-20121125/7452_1 /TAXON_ID=160619 /ORGANISM="Kryptoperidinium foliaceum, Strain CCMP 1326" /LENGTH=89 /DNA_ID=CAMNT_0017536087 /DNA_START=19 /DNA_END=285 /DNA_ORIENTATION=+